MSLKEEIYFTIPKQRYTEYEDRVYVRSQRYKLGATAIPTGRYRELTHESTSGEEITTMSVEMHCARRRDKKVKKFVGMKCYGMVKHYETRYITYWDIETHWVSEAWFVVKKVQEVQEFECST